MGKKYLKGSLLERLFLGAAVFPRVNDYTSMPRSERQSLFFDNAQMNVFAYKVKDHAFDLTSKENNVSFHTQAPLAYHSFLKHARACSDYFKQLRCTTRWNILAWLEFLTLYWLNEATYQHTPSKKTPFKNILTGLNIFIAYLFNMTAKTVNLVGTPIVLVIMGVAVETLAVMAHNVGVGYGLFAVGVIAFAMLCISFYSAFIYLISNKEESKKAFVELVDTKEASSNIIFGIFTPLIRGFQNFLNFYRQHPYYAAASLLLGCIAITFFTLLPYLGMSALLGYQLNGTILAPVIDFITAPETAPVSMAVLSKTILAGICLATMDICIRVFKEIAGWVSLMENTEKKKAEARTPPNIVHTTPPDTLIDVPRPASPPLLFSEWDDARSAALIATPTRPRPLRPRGV